MVSSNYYLHNGQTSIEGYYVDGVSLTHGQPRRHIWTYSTAVQSFPSIRQRGLTCPCFSNNDDYPSPPFVGQDYYCESGNNEDISTWLVLSQMIPCGMENNVMDLKFPAALSPTCHGSSRHLTNPPVMTLSSECVLAMGTLPMKMYP